jgi:hypothetical protein
MISQLWKRKSIRNIVLLLSPFILYFLIDIGLGAMGKGYIIRLTDRTSLLQRTIYATDADTGEQYQFNWNESTAYLCVHKPEVDLEDEIIDPSQQDLRGIGQVRFSP